MNKKMRFPYFTRKEAVEKPQRRHEFRFLFRFVTKKMAHHHQSFTIIHGGKKKILIDLNKNLLVMLSFTLVLSLVVFRKQLKKSQISFAIER